MVQTRSGAVAAPPGERRRFTAKTGYLIAYNTISAMSWAYLLYSVADPIIEDKGRTNNVYSFIRPALNGVQSAAILEIVHILLGLVKSPLITTCIQVASRLFLTWGILDYYGPKDKVLSSSPAVTTMVVAWCITEIIRYQYYAINLLDDVPAILAFLRYTLFFVLYPVGAGSEAYLAYLSLRTADVLTPWAGYAIRAILVAYIPGFYIMYTHMIKQRKRVLIKLAGGRSTSTAVSPAAKRTPKKIRKTA